MSCDNLLGNDDVPLFRKAHLTRGSISKQGDQNGRFVKLFGPNWVIFSVEGVLLCAQSGQLIGKAVAQSAHILGHWSNLGDFFLATLDPKQQDYLLRLESHVMPNFFPAFHTIWFCIESTRTPGE